MSEKPVLAWEGRPGQANYYYCWWWPGLLRVRTLTLAGPTQPWLCPAHLTSPHLTAHIISLSLSLSLSLIPQYWYFYLTPKIFKKFKQKLHNGIEMLMSYNFTFFSLIQENWRALWCENECDYNYCIFIWWAGLGWPGMAWDGLAWVSNCSYDTTGSHWGGSGGRLKTPPNTGLVGSEPNTGHYQVKYSI